MENVKKKMVKTLDNAILSLEEIRKDIEALKKVEEEVKDAIISSLQDQITQKYKEKAEPFGTVRLALAEGIEVVIDTPKKVKYDQEGMKKLYEDGAPVKCEYSLSETLYKALNDSEKSYFIPYRTVEPGKMTVKIERK